MRDRPVSGNSDNRQHSQEIDMPQAGIEPAIPASERSQACAVDLAGLAVVTNAQVITIRSLSCMPLRSPHKVHSVQKVEGSSSGDKVLYHVTCGS